MAPLEVFPDTARTRLATAWFWLYNLSLPIGLGAIALVLSGHKWAEPALIVSQIGIWAAGVMFAINVFWALRPKTTEPAAMARSHATG